MTSSDERLLRTKDLGRQHPVSSSYFAAVRLPRTPWMKMIRDRPPCRIAVRMSNTKGNSMSTIQRLLLIIASVAVLMAVTATASAANGVFWTSGTMERNLRGFGLSYYDGTFEQVHHAACDGRGANFWRGSRHVFARFRCRVIAGGDARRVITVAPISHDAYKWRQLGYW